MSFKSSLRPEGRRSTAVGLAMGIICVAVATLLVYPLREAAPATSTGVVYLVAVLIVSSFWGLPVGVFTAIVSTAAFNWFHIPPTGKFAVANADNWVALGLYLAAAVVASSVADLVRSRAKAAEQHRQEAELAAEMAQILLGSTSLENSLPVASSRLAERFGLAWAQVEVGVVDPQDGQIAVALNRESINQPVGTLVLPAETSSALLERLSKGVVPSLAALLSAALDRDELQAEVVETQALRRSDALKTALLRAVSHDLRTPLTAIIASGEALRSPTLDASSRDELGVVVVDEAQRLSRLIEKLLDLSRLQAGAATPQRDWCSIEEVLRSAVDALPPSDIQQVKISCDPDLPLLRADAAQLERAFANLIENSQRYSGTLPVQIRSRVVGTQLVIRIIDRGPGMTPTEIHRAFDAFYRGEDSHQGSGLGLAIAEGFIAANDGQIHIESLPGQGTVFVIQFPVKDVSINSARGEDPQ